MVCENCNKNEAAVPYVVHESVMARFERTIRRLWILCLVLIFVLVGTNCVWVWYESQFEQVVVTQENEDGYNNFVGNDGDIDNGNAND